MKAEAKAQEAGVEVELLVDDLTGLVSVNGEFDVLVDYGTFDDLSRKDRAAYVDQITDLAKPGAKFLLEVERWFAGNFDIQRLAGESDLPRWPRGWTAYLLTRR
jgi:hypothetical protein